MSAQSTRRDPHDQEINISNKSKYICKIKFTLTTRGTSILSSCIFDTHRNNQKQEKKKCKRKKVLPAIEMTQRKGNEILHVCFVSTKENFTPCGIEILRDEP